jgi:hypothetical protein
VADPYCRISQEEIATLRDRLKLEPVTKRVGHPDGTSSHEPATARLVVIDQPVPIPLGLTEISLFFYVLRLPRST